MTLSSESIKHVIQINTFLATATTQHLFQSLHRQSLDRKQTELISSNGFASISFLALSSPILVFYFRFYLFILSAASFQPSPRLHFSSNTWRSTNGMHSLRLEKLKSYLRRIDGRSKWRYIQVKVHSGFGLVDCATECGASGLRVSASHSELLCSILLNVATSLECYGTNVVTTHRIAIRYGIEHTMVAPIKLAPGEEWTEIDL